MKAKKTKKSDPISARAHALFDPTLDYLRCALPYLGYDPSRIMFLINENPDNAADTSLVFSLGGAVCIGLGNANTGKIKWCSHIHDDTYGVTRLDVKAGRLVDADDGIDLGEHTDLKKFLIHVVSTMTRHYLDSLSDPSN